MNQPPLRRVRLGLLVLVAMLGATGCATSSGEPATGDDGVALTEPELPAASDAPPEPEPEPAAEPETPVPDAADEPEPDSGPPDEPVQDPEPADEPPPPLDGRAIAIDPGHNGGNFDAPGEIGRPVDAGGFTKPCNTTGTAGADGYRESTFNLEVALVLRELLESRGASVHLTRETDDGVGPCIDIRGRFGTEVDADLYLSIHADGAPATARGFHVIRPTTEGSLHPSTVAGSERLAEAVRDELVAAGFAPADYTGVDGLVARGDLATLNLSSVPTVLIEAGNMRNTADLELLRDPEGQMRLATALTAAVEQLLRCEEPGRVCRAEG